MPLTAPFSGRRQGLGVAPEATRGTTPSTAAYWIPVASTSLSERVDKIRDDSGFNTIETPRGADIVKEWLDGDAEFNVYDKSIGVILLAVFGTETYTNNSPESGVGKHAYTVAQSNQHKSLSLWQKNPLEQLSAANCMVSTFNLSMVLNQYARCKIAFMGKKPVTDAESFAYVAENKFRPQDAIIKLAANIAGLGAASAVGTIKSLNLNINKNVVDYQGLGAVAPVDFVNQDFTVDGDMELAFEVLTYKNLVLNNTFNAMSIKMANTGVTIGTTTNPSLEFQLDEVDFSDLDPNRDNSNIVTLSLKFNAHYNATNSSMIQATLYNTVVAAY